MKKQVCAFFTVLALILAMTAVLVSCNETNVPAETTAAEIEAPHVHAWNSWTTTLNATCTAEGKKERSCSCGEKETQTIATLAHTEVIDKAVAATCEKEGMTEGKHCSVCQMVIVKQETISMLEHNYVNRVCLVCGYFGGSQGLYYRLSNDKTHYIVEGLGTCTDEDIYIPSTYKGLPVTGIEPKSFYSAIQVKSVCIPESITSIGDSAFSGCTSLTSITIPDSVTSIGKSAFFGCTSLAVAFINNPECSIDYDAFLPNTVLVSEHNSAVHTYIKNNICYGDILITFDEYSSGCKDLDFALSDDGKYYTVTGIGQCKDSHIVIPYLYNDLPVKAIANRAFYNCTTMKEITIPQTITSIGTQIFYKASNLHTVYYNSKYGSSDNPFMNIANITKVVFNGETVYNCILQNCTNVKEVVIGDKVEGIGDYAFSGCTSLTSITIPNSVTSIGFHTFAECTSLTSITIPDSVISVGAYAFCDCTSLTSITIPDSVTSIGEEAFSDCTSLTSITISVGVTRIRDETFKNCKSLTSVTIPDSVTSIGYDAFYDCTSLTSITIPDSVISVGAYAFSDCTSLTSITIPDSVISVGAYAFCDCTSLTSIIIPDSVTSIGKDAFLRCTSLTSITIPDSIRSIDISSFSGCTSLTSITIPDSVTSISEFAFYDCQSLKDIYYTGTEAEWKAINIGGSNSALTKATIHFNSKN